MHILLWPTEILTYAFELLQPGFLCVRERSFTRAQFNASAAVARHRQFLNLRLVCRRFNSILCSEPHLLASFVYSQAAAGNFMKKLLANFEADRGIQMLTCFSNMPCLGMLLPQLVRCPDELGLVSFSSATDSSISCLSAFTNLVTCHLHKPADSCLSLHPLAALPYLQDLLLHGAVFQNLPLGDHLTNLSIDSADVRCLAGSGEGPRLKNLAVLVFSRLELPGLGLTACSWLTRLDLQLSEITAEGAADRYNLQKQLPESASKLITLTNLTVAMLDDRVYIEPYTVLPALTRLHLLPKRTCTVSGITAGLSRLQMLVVTAIAPNRVDPPPTVVIALNWLDLKGLQCLTLTGKFSFYSSVLQLVKLSKLRQFHLVSFWPENEATCHLVTALTDQFAVHQPRVHVSIT